MPGARRALETSLRELEALCREQGELAERLVHLREIPLGTLRTEVRRTEEILCRSHSHAVEACEGEGRANPGEGLELSEVLRRDHTRFEDSVRELRWYLDRVAGDAHAGNRQALGQYWRLVVEAVARHAAEERESLAGSVDGRDAEDGVIRSARSLPPSGASAWPSRTN